jgi:hypothetical protein
MLHKIVTTSAIFRKKKLVPERIVTENLVGEREVLAILMPEKKVLEFCSRFHPS